MTTECCVCGTEFELGARGMSPFITHYFCSEECYYKAPFNLDDLICHHNDKVKMSTN